MNRRAIHTPRPRGALFDLPVDETSPHRHCTLADDDLKHIARRRRTKNKLGLALQLCALPLPRRRERTPQS